MEFTIDDLHYYSYPLPCVEDHNSNDIAVKQDIITLFNVIIITVKRSAVLRILQRKLLNLHTLLFTNSNIMKKLTVYNIEYIHQCIHQEFQLLSNMCDYQHLPYMSSPPTTAPFPSRSGYNSLHTIYGLISDIYDTQSVRTTVTAEYFMDQLKPLVTDHYCKVSDEVLRRYLYINAYVYSILL